VGKVVQTENAINNIYYMIINGASYGSMQQTWEDWQSSSITHATQTAYLNSGKSTDYQECVFLQTKKSRREPKGPLITIGCVIKTKPGQNVNVGQ
jgi:hypothetical protein